MPFHQPARRRLWLRTKPAPESKARMAGAVGVTAHGSGHRPKAPEASPQSWELPANTVLHAVHIKTNQPQA